MWPAEKLQFCLICLFQKLCDWSICILVNSSLAFSESAGVLVGLFPCGHMLFMLLSLYVDRSTACWLAWINYFYLYHLSEEWIIISVSYMSTSKFANASVLGCDKVHGTGLGWSINVSIPCFIAEHCLAKTRSMLLHRWFWCCGRSVIIMFSHLGSASLCWTDLTEGRPQI